MYNYNNNFDAHAKMIKVMTYLRYLCLFALSNIYCVVVFVFWSSSCVPTVARFSELSILDCLPLRFSLTFIS